MQEAFCLAYIETGNASEAYRRSYGAENYTENALNVQASKMLKHPKIVLRLGELQQVAEDRALLTLEEHMAELQTLREMAKQNAQLSAAIKAEELRGKLRRFYVDRTEVTGKDGGPIETEDVGDQGGDDLARRIAVLLSGNAKPNGHAPS